MENNKPPRKLNAYNKLALGLWLILGSLAIGFTHTALLPLIAGLLTGLLLAAPNLIVLLRGRAVLRMAPLRFMSARTYRWFMLLVLIGYLLFYYSHLAEDMHQPSFGHRLFLYFMTSGLCFLGSFTALLFFARIEVIDGAGSPSKGNDGST